MHRDYSKSNGKETIGTLLLGFLWWILMLVGVLGITVVVAFMLVFIYPLLALFAFIMVYVYGNAGAEE